MANAEMKVWTPEEIAQMTRTSLDAVLREIQAGSLSAFQIGDEIRILDANLQSFLTGGIRKAIPTQACAKGWRLAEAFSYVWPAGTREYYPEAFDSEVSFGRDMRHFRIGYTTRKAAGEERRRVVVFLNREKYLVPVVEFAGTDDFEKTGLVASIVKDCGNKHIRSQAQLPPEYYEFKTAMYNEFVTGPYAASSVAVIADENDRDTMLRHAIIRAKNKSMLNL